MAAMNGQRRLLSIYEWIIGALRKAKGNARRAESCKSCQLPLEKSAPIAGHVYCQVCHALIETASTPYLLAIQERYQEEQKRKMILMPRGNYRKDNEND
jgi:uncharacterized Zn finger protein (UPF0148 family)